MNQVSDINLAVACHEAGILPSISVYTFKERMFLLDHNVIDREIKKFQDRTGSSNILISVARGDFLKQTFYDMIMKNNIKFVELIPNDIAYPTQEEKTLYRQYTEAGVVALAKRLDSNFEPIKFSKGLVLKNREGAGRVNINADPVEEIKKIRSLYPDLEIIMSGGIGTRDDVKKYLDLGCIAVAIGTLLAASEESCISHETKLKLIESTWQDITTLSKGAEQNGLVFSQVSNDDFNHTEALKLGVKDPTQGLLFAGKGINNIKSIMPVKDIVQALVDGL
jgi:NAD(P)H-dependent flavin oxidoreductase YrpB (nitropropane dioxygenase family)